MSPTTSMRAHPFVPALTPTEQAQRSLSDAMHRMDEFLRFGPHPEWAEETPAELQSVIDLITGAQRHLRSTTPITNS